MSDHNYQGGPAPSQSNGLAVASLVLGIVGLLLALVPVIGFISWILAPVGLILGFIAMGKPTGKGLAIGGLVTSGLALLVCIAWVAVFGAALSTSGAVGY